MARLERDLERVLEDLADNFPLLRSLVDRRAGGQKRLPMPGRGGERVPAPLFTTVTPEPPPPESPPVHPEPVDEDEPLAPVGGEMRPRIAATGAPESVAGRCRPARYGLLLQFESRSGDPELGRLVDNTIWINDVHPAYTRAVASRSLGYHTAIAVALALAPLAVEGHDEHAFVTQFLAQWGATQTAKRAACQRRARV